MKQDKDDDLLGAVAEARQTVKLIAELPGALVAFVAKHAYRGWNRSVREIALEPNKYSDLKIERYTFAANAVIEHLGKPQALSGHNSPDVNFRPIRVTTNVDAPGIVYITDARVANVCFTVGGRIDAWQWCPSAHGQELDVPTLTPANSASFSGHYTGRTPKGSTMRGYESFDFVLSFTGPASITA